MLEYLGINLIKATFSRDVCMHIKQYQQWLIDFQQDNHTLLKLYPIDNALCPFGCKL